MSWKEEFFKQVEKDQDEYKIFDVFEVRGGEIRVLTEKELRERGDL